MAVVPIISQSWDINSYVNPTRMNNIETNIATVSKATGVEYSSGVSVKDKIDTINTDLTNNTPKELGSISANSTRNLEMPFQSSCIIYFLGSTYNSIGMAIIHSWSSDKEVRFIGTQPSNVSFVKGPSTTIAITNNSSGATLLVYCQKVRGDLPYFSTPT